MSITKTRAFVNAKKELDYIREAQKVTANNIARVQSPGAQPLKLERAGFQSTLELAQPNHGQGFNANHAFLSQYTSVVDKDNQTEGVPGESRISIENESVRMADLDDQHLLTLGIKKGWGKAFRSIISG